MLAKWEALLKCHIIHFSLTPLRGIVIKHIEDCQIN